MSRARVGGIELHVEERGDGEPLLLIAGIPAIADDWTALAEPLAATRRPIAYDNRGSGRSTVTPGPYSTRGLAADAAGLLDALGIERADVFGMSLGGMIAQELALGWPRRVRRLILGCTHAGLAHAAPMPRDVDPATLEAFIAKKARDVQEPVGYRAQIDAVLGHDSFARLRGLHAPTLILTGDDDRIIPAAGSDVLHERIPGSRLEVLAGTGHLFFLEQPERTRALIEGFLAE